jgi:molecular chaperone GrpE (heat shock protein)
MIETGRKDQDNTVLEVVAYGYSLNGKVIREPQVKVGQFEI